MSGKHGPGLVFRAQARVSSPARSSGWAGRRCRATCSCSTDLNAGFLRRYREAYGRFAPPVSSIAESACEAVHLYARAAHGTGPDGPAAAARALRRSRTEFPRGAVTVAGPETVRQQLYLAEAMPGGFAVRRAG